MVITCMQDAGMVITCMQDAGMVITCKQTGRNGDKLYAGCRNCNANILGAALIFLLRISDPHIDLLHLESSPLRMSLSLHTPSHFVCNCII